MKTLKIFTLALTLLFMANFAKAQGIEKEDPASRAQRITEQLAAKVEIKDAKITDKIYAINLAAVQQLDSASRQCGLNTVALRKQVKEIDKARYVAICNILDYRQISRYGRYRDELMLSASK